MHWIGPNRFTRWPAQHLPGFQIKACPVGTTDEDLITDDTAGEGYAIVWAGVVQGEEFFS